MEQLLLVQNCAHPSYHNGAPCNSFQSMPEKVLGHRKLPSSDLFEFTMEKGSNCIYISRLVFKCFIIDLFHDEQGDRFPHLANAAKYVSSLLVTLFGIFHPLYLEYGTGKDLQFTMNFYQSFWTFLFVVTSIYAFIWDVYMDFGLGLKQYSYLNQPLMYPQKSYYYSTIGIDLVLRFLWVLTLVPPDSGASFALPEYLTALVMMLELSRRTLWGFFRLENEHRNNEHKYRRAGFVPLHFNTGHKHMYQNKKERPGSEVLPEVIFVTLVVGMFCFATIAAAQHANQRYPSYKEL